MVIRSSACAREGRGSRWSLVSECWRIFHSAYRGGEDGLFCLFHGKGSLHPARSTSDLISRTCG